MEKKMKKLLWFWAALVTASLMFPGCPTEPEEDPSPPVELGDGELSLNGDIYEEVRSFHPDYGYSTYTYTKTAKSGLIYTTINGQQISAPITGGVFDITIPKPADSSLSPLSQNSSDLEDWPVTISDETARAMVIPHLETAGEIGTQRIQRNMFHAGEPDGNNRQVTQTMISYIYVDKEVTMKAPPYTRTETYPQGDTIIISIGAFSLKFAKGWNVLYTTSTTVMSVNGETITVEYSKNNPVNLYWTYRDVRDL
jgi:hypothetical protein